VVYVQAVSATAATPLAPHCKNGTRTEAWRCGEVLLAVRVDCRAEQFDIKVKDSEATWQVLLLPSEEASQEALLGRLVDDLDVSADPPSKKIG